MICVDDADLHMAEAPESSRICAKPKLERKTRGCEEVVTMSR
jgi:hypothetical protein